MSKIIIENRSSISDCDALSVVSTVVSWGRMSGSGDKAQYCYYSTFRNPKVGVSAFKNKASDRFVVIDIKGDSE